MSGRGLDIRSPLCSGNMRAMSSSGRTASTFIACSSTFSVSGGVCSSSSSLSLSSSDTSSSEVKSGTGPYSSGMASSRSSRKPTAKAATNNCHWNKRNRSTSRLTTEFVEVLHPPARVRRVPRHLSPFRRTVLTQLLDAHSQLVQRIRRIPSR